MLLDSANSNEKAIRDLNVAENFDCCKLKISVSRVCLNSDKVKFILRLIEASKVFEKYLILWGVKVQLVGLYERSNLIMTTFRNKTVFITGASRGIGKAIGLRLAREGANIVVTGKSDQPHPKLEGTIHSAAKEMIEAGGKAIAIAMDVRDEASVVHAVNEAAKTFGGIDVLVNNASAINLQDTEHLEMKRFDLMHQVNVRGTYMTSKYVVPHLKGSENPHILNLSPPLNFETKWFAPHLGYSMAKYGMSLCVLGMHEELKKYDIAVNALWPATTIATAAVRNLLGGEEVVKRSRTPEIVADAAFHVLKRNSSGVTGNFYIDEEVLAEEGVTDLSMYSVDKGSDLIPDFFL
jgi:citronellol/citronellal dehydrogenase